MVDATDLDQVCAGRWRTDAATYVRAVRRYADEIGHLDWAAPRDRMTEAPVLARTGLSLRTHQHLTVVDYLRLRDLDPDLPFIPVLQGQSITDYHRCADLYEARGIDLAALPIVGVGSVCRRQHTREVEQILRSLAARDYRLHAFGAKVLGLARYADAITSSDSAAWSLRGRHVAGCSPTHRSESNCLRFALAWHTRLTDTLTPKAMETSATSKPSTTASAPTAPACSAHRLAAERGVARSITPRPPDTEDVLARRAA
jgi:hypothetical protein